MILWRGRKGAPDVILVGRPGQACRADWVKLAERVARGGVAILLEADAMGHAADPLYWLPLERKGTCRVITDWLYHKECVAKRHPLFEGLQAGGVMDWDYYDQVIGHSIFEGQGAPADVTAAAFAAGYNTPGGYVSGTMLATHALGRGRVILNTFNILSQVDRNPAADRLLLNLLQRARSQAARRPGKLPAGFERRLKAIYPAQAAGDFLMDWETAAAPLPERPSGPGHVSNTGKKDGLEENGGSRHTSRICGFPLPRRRDRRNPLGPDDVFRSSEPGLRTAPGRRRPGQGVDRRPRSRPDRSRHQSGFAGPDCAAGGPGPGTAHAGHRLPPPGGRIVGILRALPAQTGRHRNR